MTQRTIPMLALALALAFAAPQALAGAAAQEVERLGKDLTPGGNGVAHSGTSTVPFPFPKAGEDLLWNHNFRWRGGSVERDSSWYVVQPNGANFRVATTDRFVFENAGYLDTRRDNMNFVWMGYYRAPATL